MASELLHRRMQSRQSHREFRAARRAHESFEQQIATPSPKYSLEFLECGRIRRHDTEASQILVARLNGDHSASERFVQPTKAQHECPMA